MSEIGEWVANDEGPGNDCFGYGHRNETGLRLRFRRTGEATAETEYTVPASYRGPAGVAHGGIQATLLDEICAWTILLTQPERFGLVTAEFSLRYRRPVPIETPLRIVGRMERVEGTNLFVSAEILDLSGEVLTKAEARFRRLN